LHPTVIKVRIKVRVKVRAKDWVRVKMTYKYLIWIFVQTSMNYNCLSFITSPTVLDKLSYNRINAFEQSCYRRMLKIKWIDKVSNEETLQMPN